MITRPSAPAGRGRALMSSPVAAVAIARGLPLLTPLTARNPEFLAELSRLAPDVGVVVAYGQILRPVALNLPAHGWINLHFSHLGPGGARRRRRP